MNGYRNLRGCVIAREYRINRQIRAREVRLIGGADGSTEATVLPLERALAMAEEQGLDLVEVSPNQNPPVCKLLDYGRFKFVQAKKAKEARRSQVRSEQREVQLTPRIGEHDIESKIRTVRDLLTGGAKVKVSVKFRGREITHPDLAVKVLRRVAEAVAAQAKLERAPTMEAKSLSIILAPAGSQAVAAVAGGKGADAQNQNA
ncbi:MAG: translation initiation factor IF-3 [Chloroflexi bacterium]|nr:translation initiation factor IF-3 [Chloroflexota bacterium]